MPVKATYRPLVEVAVLHRYFLDEGTTVFDLNPELRAQQLKNYNWREFGSILPTPDTALILKNHRLYLKPTQTGFSIWVQALPQNPQATVFQPLIELDALLQLNFFLVVDDALFGNYSQLDGVDYYPLLFRNYNGLLDPALPKINRVSEKTAAHNYAISQDTYKTLSKAYTSSLSGKVKGLISLQMRGSGSGYHLLLTNKNLPAEPPRFNIRFDNRKTIWNYYSGKDRSLIHSTDPDENPLVKNGIVSISQGNTDYPAASPQSVIWERDTNGNLLKTYSKIYIN